MNRRLQAFLRPKVLSLTLVFLSLVGILTYAVSRELTVTGKLVAAARPALRPLRPALSPAEEAYIRGCGRSTVTSREAPCA